MLQIWTKLRRLGIARVAVLVAVLVCSSNALTIEEREGEWGPSPRSSHSTESRRGHFGRTHHLPTRVQGALQIAPAPNPIAEVVDLFRLDVAIAPYFGPTGRPPRLRLAPGVGSRRIPRGPPLAA